MAKFFLCRLIGQNITAKIQTCLSGVKLSDFGVAEQSNNFRVGLSHNPNFFGGSNHCSIRQCGSECHNVQTG